MPDKEVAQKIAEVLAASRERAPLSPRQELKRRAEQALKAAKYRGASPETRKRYEVEKSFEDRATKALSEAVARSKCTATGHVQLSGGPMYPSAVHGDAHGDRWSGYAYEEPSVAPEQAWGAPAEAEEYFGAWSMEAGMHAMPEVEEYGGYDSSCWMQDARASEPWPVQEALHSWAGESGFVSAAHDRSQGAGGTSHTSFAAKRTHAEVTGNPPARHVEETEVLRAWAETTTAASSNRSVASAADSNSEELGRDANDDDDADELLASCWKAVAEAAEELS